MTAYNSPGNMLCQSCGLCCTGHLFAWTKLRSTELDSAEALGLDVIRSLPSQRGFNQPCPLWQGQCTIYGTANYPRSCHTYKCKMLKRLLNEDISLGEALHFVEQAKRRIKRIEARLPNSPKRSFRDQLAERVEALEHRSPPLNREELDFQREAGELLAFYEEVFAVNDVVAKPPSL